jgi:hypothetical protein
MIYIILWIIIGMVITYKAMKRDGLQGAWDGDDWCVFVFVSAYGPIAWYITRD